jgi:hypothetical protein
LQENWWNRFQRPGSGLRAGALACRAHISIETTERYLGKQKLRNAVNDRLGIEPDTSA